LPSICRQLIASAKAVLGVTFYATKIRLANPTLTEKNRNWQDEKNSFKLPLALAGKELLR